MVGWPKRQRFFWKLFSENGCVPEKLELGQFGPPLFDLGNPSLTGYSPKDSLGALKWCWEQILMRGMPCLPFRGKLSKGGDHAGFNIHGCFSWRVAKK